MDCKGTEYVLSIAQRPKRIIAGLELGDCCLSLPALTDLERHEDQRLKKRRGKEGG